MHINFSYGALQRESLKYLSLLWRWVIHLALTTDCYRFPRKISLLLLVYFALNPQCDSCQEQLLLTVQDFVHKQKKGGKKMSELDWISGKLSHELQCRMVWRDVWTCPHTSPIIGQSKRHVCPIIVIQSKHDGLLCIIHAMRKVYWGKVYWGKHKLL